MLDELRDLFLAALKFDGNDAMPLVNRWNEAVKRVQAVFDNMTSKTVDAVEVRHGKWVWNENGVDWGLGAWECSECHRKPETWWEADKGNPYRCAGSSYCNNCGAKMTEV